MTLQIQVSSLLIAGSRSDPVARPSMLEAEVALSMLLADEVRLRQLSVVVPAVDQERNSVCPFHKCLHAVSDAHCKQKSQGRNIISN